MTFEQATPIWHTIIIGAGASGLMCAGSFRAPKLVLEHNNIPGRKLNITGGGKCNFTHRGVTERDYVCSAVHFAHKALAAYPPAKFLSFLREQKIAFCEQEDGKFFANKASDITQALFQQARHNNTTFSFNTEVLQITHQQDVFSVRTSKGLFRAYHIVVASGGLSYPDLGASGLAWQLAQSFNIQTIPPRPVLAGFRLDKSLRMLCKTLAGNSLPVKIHVGKHIEKGNLLFTHEGISGPAVLQTSLYWNEGEKIEVDFCPGTDVLNFLRTHKNSSHLFSKILADILPIKITKNLLGPLDVNMANATKSQLVQAGQQLQRFSCIPLSTAGYTRAEATAGGLAPDELYPHSLECRKIPGLYFIGEAVDVTGRVGGYNLNWAWASAVAAAKSLAEK